VTPPGATAAVSCANATGAALSSTPFRLPVTGGKCAAGSGFSFNFRQVQDDAVTLEVVPADGGPTATYTSGTGEVETVSTGSTPLDTATLYTGPQAFNLTVAA
jgi:hypothetical protein